MHTLHSHILFLRSAQQRAEPIPSSTASQVKTSFDLHLHLTALSSLAHRLRDVSSDVTCPRFDCSIFGRDACRPTMLQTRNIECIIAGGRNCPVRSSTEHRSSFHQSRSHRSREFRRCPLSSTRSLSLDPMPSCMIDPAHHLPSRSKKH